MNAFERRNTVWRIMAFVVLVTAVAWVSPLLGGSPTSPGLGFILWGATPLLVSLMLRFVTRDWSDIGVKPAIRKNARWYVVSFLVFPVIMLLTLSIGVLMSVAFISEFSMGKYFQTALTALPIFSVFAIFEEVGWRGYLSPKLASLGINSYLAAALIGVVWASWHLPYLRELSWVYSSEDLVTFIPRAIALEFLCDSNTRCGIMEVYSSLFFRQGYCT
jgi:membrane protease YdiL (CAAX protease family)